MVNMPLVSECLSGHLCLRDELRDLLAGVEGRHLHVRDAPVSAAGRVQDLVMLLQDFTETGEVQVLPATTSREIRGVRRSDFPSEGRVAATVAVLRPGSSAAG